jgi:signal transduction histidine kinase
MEFNSLPQTSTHPIVSFQEHLIELGGIIQDLPASDDLEVAFSRIQQETPAGAGAKFRVVREGRPRGLRPVIRQEAYRIGREAVLNAFRHSGASRVEVDLEYAPTRLRVTVRDDGKGIMPGLLGSGCGGHRGLSAMRDLAEQMGAKLKLLSRVAAGTEVELSIPGGIAFSSPTKLRRLGWPCMSEAA